MLDKSKQRTAEVAADEAARMSASAEKLADAEASAVVSVQRCAGFRRTTVELLKQKMMDLGDHVPAAAGCGSQEELGDCVICLKALTEKTHAMVPCGHTAICGDCWNTVVVEPCPVCRVTVTQAIALF